MDKTIHALGHTRHSHVCQILLQLACFVWVFFPFFSSFYWPNKRCYLLYQPCLTLLFQAASLYQQPMEKSQTNTTLPKNLPGGEILMMKIDSMVCKEIICTKSALCSWTPALSLLNTPGILLDLYPYRRQHWSEQELEAQRENQLQFRLIHFPWE